MKLTKHKIFYLKVNKAAQNHCKTKLANKIKTGIKSHFFILIRKN